MGRMSAIDAYMHETGSIIEYTRIARLEWELTYALAAVTARGDDTTELQARLAELADAANAIIDEAAKATLPVLVGAR